VMMKLHEQEVTDWMTTRYKEASAEADDDDDDDDDTEDEEESDMYGADTAADGGVGENGRGRAGESYGDTIIDPGAAAREGPGQGNGGSAGGVSFASAPSTSSQQAPRPARTMSINDLMNTDE